MWHGHLVSLVEDQYLVGTMIDQVNERFEFAANPMVLDLKECDWFEQRWPGHFATKNLALVPGLTIHYEKFHCHNGWKSVTHFRPGREKEDYQPIDRKESMVVIRQEFVRDERP